MGAKMARKARTGKGRNSGWFRDRSSGLPEYLTLTDDSNQLRANIGAALERGAHFEDVFLPEFKRVFGERGEDLLNNSDNPIVMLIVWLAHDLNVPRESVEAMLDVLGIEH